MFDPEPLYCLFLTEQSVICTTPTRRKQNCRGCGWSPNVSYLRREALREKQRLGKLIEPEHCVHCAHCTARCEHFKAEKKPCSGSR